MKLDKGDFTILLQVRHEKKDALERIKDVVLLVGQKLPSNISMDLYASHANALAAGRKFSAKNLAPNTGASVYITPLADDKWVVMIYIGLLYMLNS